MTAPNTPQLDSEELRQQIAQALKEAFGMTYIDPDSRPMNIIIDLVKQDRAAFADRVLAVVPEKIRQLCEERGQTLQPDMILVPLPIHQVTTAITNLVAEERGEKKG